MRLVLIAAMAENRVIGKNGTMPWHLPADLAHFKRETQNSPMLMGRKTFESLPGLLPGRPHIVVTRGDWSALGCQVFKSIDNALQSLSNESVVMVIGGGQVYKQVLPRAHTVILTEIHTELEGDSFFPTLQADQWQETKREQHQADEKNQYNFDFVTYQRIEST